jgi:ferric-dicitrate binding protein FerR (iron transport regulator)
MPHPVSRLSYLFKRYTENSCTTEERNEFIQMVKQEENTLELNGLISNAVNLAAPDHEINQEKADELFDGILKGTPDNEAKAIFPLKKNKKIWWAAAAIIMLVFGSGVYFILNKNKPLQIARKVGIHKQLKNDVAPGYKGAVLTLSNGQQIILDSVGNGMLTAQGNTNILKQNGKIVYDEQNISKSEVLYNIMTTPRGRQYSLVLADGTKVWLNAASSITFPTTFTGNERRVQITGEAYFEVAPLTLPTGQAGPEGGHGRVPFIVSISSTSGKLDGAEVRVLGTHFNIKAYDDESSIKTTLLEGSVRVTKENSDALLKPGQEAILDDRGGDFKIVRANIEEAVAWKNGLFEFNNADIRSIRRQLGRWYDVEVVYQGDVADKKFSGVMSQNTNLSQVLKMLQLTKEVHFKMKGAKVVVSP